MRIPVLLCSLSLLLVACGSKNAVPPTDASSGAVTESKQLLPKPEANYTTVPATGAFVGVIPDGFEIVKSEAGEIISIGDMNADGINDAAILVQNFDDERGSAAILVAHGEAGGKYSLGEMSGLLGAEPLMSPDPGMLTIDKGVLTFHFQSMRWSTDLKFRKEAKYGDLRLIGSETENYGNAVHDGAGSASTNYLTGQRVSNYMSWDEDKQDLIDLPEKREKVSTTLKAFKGFDEDAIYDGL
jgi:hypothetical protein